jgi:hypothetical protein
VKLATKVRFTEHDHDICVAERLQSDRDRPTVEIFRNKNGSAPARTNYSVFGAIFR